MAADAAGVGPGREPSGAGVARRLAGLAARLTYRDIELVTVGEAPTGPTVLVANHFGGLADAVLLVYLSGRFPRVVARDVIWGYPMAGRFMRWVGAIPVHRRADSGTGRPDNDAMFASCYRAIRDGSLVLIFPEGVTQDVPHLAPVKTGAARIALGAKAAGTSGIEIRAAGIHYEDKAAFRSRALVALGEPLSVDDFVAGRPADRHVGADSRDLVRSLTADVAHGLRDVAPDYSSWEEAHDLQLAAQATVRAISPGPLQAEPVPLSASEPVASALAALPDESVAAVRATADGYRRALHAAGLSDATLGSAAAGPRLVRTLGNLALIAILAPYAALGVLLGLVPYLLTQATRLVPAAPAVRATLLPAVAALVFLAEWMVTSVSVGVRDGWFAGATVALLAPAFVAAAVLVSERAVLIWREAQRWWTHLRRRPSINKARAARADLLDVVATALGQVVP